MGWTPPFFLLCESPTEERLLEILIEEAHLVASKVQLFSHINAMRLELKVRVLDYYVDFLVSDSIVVHVDEYREHSSEEAFINDRKQDQALILAGYSPIRFSINQINNDPVKVAQTIIRIAQRQGKM